MTGSPLRTRAFGIAIDADVPLPHLAEDAGRGPADLSVRRVPALSERGEGTHAGSRITLFRDGLRLATDPGISFDLIDGTRLDYAAAGDWPGIMPARFYSTALALALAWRGATALHASAVAVDGRALLICGQTGAGKSTVTAAMVACGAGFIGDDLAVVSDEDGGACVHRGRITMRLHPDTAQWVPSRGAAPDRRDTRGKWLIEPVAEPGAWMWPLGAIAFLGPSPAGQASPAGALHEHLFRPRLQAMLPHHDAIQDRLTALLQTVPAFAVPAVDVHDRASFERVGRAMLARTRAVLV